MPFSSGSGGGRSGALLLPPPSPSAASTYSCRGRLRCGGARCGRTGRRAPRGAYSPPSGSLTSLPGSPTALGASAAPTAPPPRPRHHGEVQQQPGGVVIDGVAYRLRQMHWNAPSEHTINGRRYAFELHMLHQSDANSNKYAVVAQLYTISRRRRDRTVHRLERYIRRITRRKGGDESEGGAREEWTQKLRMNKIGVFYISTMVA
ncbi:hypothetical protein PAHAL_3G158800 [Panicum hallii]|uniref:Carbonic anhydrase n=1 Tax=Panicum hallii TaxID=206008 RepID=A0A2T8KIF1_9POAL|nr:hypothetical protein PAHAL_3G158800 [Panicum hallii]